MEIPNEIYKIDTTEESPNTSKAQPSPEDQNTRLGNILNILFGRSGGDGDGPCGVGMFVENLEDVEGTFMEVGDVEWNA